jgi:biopolymer transport protein ExbD
MGGGGGYSSDINVTPMIDVLLVLLIIFMVIVPVTPKGLEALVPQPPKHDAPHDIIEHTIVVQVLTPRSGECAASSPSAPPCYKINDQTVFNGVGGPLAQKELLATLTNIYANRAERVMFVKGDDDPKHNLDFRYVAEVIDLGRAANVDHIGLMTPRIMAGQ